MKGKRLKNKIIRSVLFCCNYNSIRSPMAEGIFKKLIGKKVFVQSVGIFDTLEVDGFTVRVCNEIDVKLNQHRVRSLSEVEKQGGFVGSFDLVIPMTEQALNEVKKFSRYCSLDIEKWDIEEPRKTDQDIMRTIESYRYTRDLIYKKILNRFHDLLN